MPGNRGQFARRTQRQVAITDHDSGFVNEQRCIAEGRIAQAAHGEFLLPRHAQPHLPGAGRNDDGFRFQLFAAPIRDHEVIACFCDLLSRIQFAGEFQVLKLAAEFIDGFQAADDLVVLDPWQGETVLRLAAQVFGQH